MTIIKVKDNEYRLDGVITYMDENIEYVVVDGKEYHHKERYFASFDLSESFNNNREQWKTFEINEFVQFGLPSITLWDSRVFYESLYNDYLPYRLSRNFYMNIIMNLHELRIIDKNVIKSLSISRDGGFNNINNIIKNKEIQINIISYRGHTLVAHICLYKFLKMDFSKFTSNQSQNVIKELNEKNPTLFPAKLFKGQLTNIETNKVLINFLNLNINLKQKQKFYETS